MKHQEAPRSGQRLLRTREVAERLGISQSSARNLISDGKLKAVRINTLVRVPVDELDRFIADLSAS